MNTKAEYAIITDFNAKIKIYFYYFKIIRYFLYMIINRLFNNKKKYLYYKYFLNDYIKSKGHRIISHSSLLKSLLRGFYNLKIKYTYNKITPDTKYLILLWIDRNDLETIKKMKTENNIEKIICLPVACKYDYDFVYDLIKNDYVDSYIAASEWVRELYKQKVDKKYWDKIIVWPSGVELGKKRINNEPRKKCIYYTKNVEKDNRIIELLNALNIQHFDFVYEDYQFSEYKETLKQVDFAIFNVSIIETQGLAVAEAWAEDVPVIINKLSNEYIDKSVPYLCNQNGLEYNSFDELKNILCEYDKNPKEFLNKFNAFEYVKQNMTDEVSVNNLIDIIKFL